MSATNACPACGDNGGSIEHSLDAAQSHTNTLSRRTVLRGGAVAAGAVAALHMSSALARPVFGSTAQSSLWPIPNIITRSQWGADESLRVAPAIYDETVEKVIIHHTVTQNNRTDHPALVRNVFNYHVSHLYSDIAYNLLIDERGAIYEGRWAADYHTGGPHTGEDALRRQVRGAHSLHHNARTIGIALLGTFDTIAPPPPMIDALVEVLAWKCGRWNLDPTGASVFTNALDEDEHLDNIIGHRDVRQTLCPGSAARAVLPTVRTRVKAIVDARLQRERDEFWKVLPGLEPRRRQPRG